jgi:F-type H+-transporting ATPase subunit delta
VTERTIARRWVRALFELALEAEEAERVQDDLRHLAERLAADGAARAKLADPRTGKRAKSEAAEKLLPAAARPLSRDFVAMAVARGREEILPIAHEEFAAMGRDQRGEALAEVVSAAPLDADAKTALLSRLEDLTRRKITLQERVDAGLIGGLRVRVGSMLLDGSVKRRLAGMRDELRRVALPKAPAEKAT